MVGATVLQTVERAVAHEINELIDLWSFGCVLLDIIGRGQPLKLMKSDKQYPKLSNRLSVQKTHTNQVTGRSPSSTGQQK